MHKFIPQQVENESFQTLIGRFPKNVQKALQDWLGTLDFEAITARSQFAKTYQALAVLALYCGPLGRQGKEMVGAIAEARKCTDSYARTFGEYLNIDFPEEIREEMQGHLDQYRDTVMALLTPEQQAQFLKAIEQDTDETA